MKMNTSQSSELASVEKDNPKNAHNERCLLPEKQLVSWMHASFSSGSSKLKRTIPQMWELSINVARFLTWISLVFVWVGHSEHKLTG